MATMDLPNNIISLFKTYKDTMVKHANLQLKYSFKSIDSIIRQLQLLMKNTAQKKNDS